MITVLQRSKRLFITAGILLAVCGARDGSINTRVRFDAPDPFVPVALPVNLSGGRLEVKVPSKSVTLIELK